MSAKPSRQFNKTASTIRNAFIVKWNEITEIIDYDSRWEGKRCLPTDVGRATPLVTIRNMLEYKHVQEIKPGELAKTMDDNGRHIIVVGTLLGPVVLTFFNSTNTIVEMIATKRFLSSGFHGGSVFGLSEKNLDYILGAKTNNYKNVGDRINIAFNCFKDPDYQPGLGDPLW